MTNPTCEQIFNEELGDPIDTKLGTWRHGVVKTEVYHRKDDYSFWQVKYACGNDGDYNELREGLAIIKQVYPKEKTVVYYE